MAFLDRKTVNVLLTILLFASVLGIVYMARSVLAIFCLSILFAYLIDPVVSFLDRHSLLRRKARGVHIAEAYIGVLILVAGAVYVLIPQASNRPGAFLQNVASFSDRLSSGEIATEVGQTNGWSEAQTLRAKEFLTSHRETIRKVSNQIQSLGRKMGNWLTRNQAQELVNAASKTNLRGWRDGAMVGLLLGCGLRRSEVVGLNLDQMQSREGRWVIVNLVGKGARLRTVPVPSWSKELVDAWLRHSGVTGGKVFRQVLKGGTVQPSGVTANVVWYAVKRCAGQAGMNNLAPHDLRRTCARLCHGSGGELEQIQFLLCHASVQTMERYIGSKQKLQDAVNDRLGISVARENA